VLGRAAPHNSGYGGGYSGHYDGGHYDGGHYDGGGYDGGGYDGGGYDGNDGGNDGGGYDGNDGGGYDGNDGGGYDGDNGGGYGGRNGGGFNDAEGRDATQLHHKPCDLKSGRPQFRDAKNHHNRYHGRNSVHRFEKKESADHRATADNSRSTTHGHQHRRVSQAQPVVAGNAAQSGWLAQPSRLRNSNHRNQQQQYNGKQLREEPDRCQTSLLAEQLREQNKELYRLLAQVRTELATCKHDLAKCRSELAPCMQHAINLRKQVIYERQQKHKALTEIQRLHSLGNASATTPATRHGYDHKRINNKPSRYTPDCHSNKGRGANDSNNGRGDNDNDDDRGHDDNDDARGHDDNDDARADDARDDDACADDDRGDYSRGDDDRGTNDGDCIDKATKNRSKTYQDNGSTGQSNDQSKDQSNDQSKDQSNDQSKGQSNDQSKGQSSDQHDATAAAAADDDDDDDDDENSCDTNDDHTSTGQSSDSDKMSSHRTGRNCKRRFHEISSNSAASATLSNTPAQQADVRCSADKQASV
jgi:hypothetical protein